LFCLPFTILAQPSITFSKDSIKIGEEVKLTMVFRHSPTQEVFFPDSTYNFAPFEYVSRLNFPTRTVDTISTDCTIYTLQTFELDPKQWITLQATILSGKDSIEIPSNEAFIWLQEVITEMPDSLDLKANTEFLEVKKQFNYPYFIIATSILAFLSFGILLVYGKTIWKKIVVYRWHKKHRKAMIEYENLTSDYQKNITAKQIESLVNCFKMHLEWITDKKITAYSTRDFERQFPSLEVLEELKKADAFVFGGLKTEIQTGILRKFLEKEFDDKITNYLQNGK
jgi:hypothetical protein